MQGLRNNEKNCTHWQLRGLRVGQVDLVLHTVRSMACEVVACGCSGAPAGSGAGSSIAAPHTSSQVITASSTLSSRPSSALCSADVENVFMVSARLRCAVFQLLLPNELLTKSSQPVNSNSVIVLLSKFPSARQSPILSQRPTNPTFWITYSTARVGPDFGKPRTCTSQPTILVLL